MKKVLFGLLMVAFLMPCALQAQSNASHHVILDTAACDSLTWINGQTYTTDTNVLYTSNDTLYVLDLHMGHSYNIPERSVTAGCSYSWGDTTITTAGIYHDTLYTVVGHCDSIFSLNLTFSGIEYDTVAKQGCASYTWDKVDSTFTTSTLYTYQDTSVANCTKYHTLDLTIITPETHRGNDTVFNTCNSSINITLFGVRRTLSGSGAVDSTFTKPYRTVEQCYDTTIHVTVNFWSPVMLPAESVTACDNYYWPVSDSTYALSGHYTYKFDERTIHNCDSSAQLDLTITASPVITAVEGTWHVAPGDSAVLTAICNQSGVTYKWTYNGQTSTGSTLTIPNVHGNIDVMLVVSKNGCSDTAWATVVSYLGIETADNTNMRLFPNPASHNLNITSDENISEVVIYNMMGQQVIIARELGNQANINIDSLTNGSYSVRVVMANGQVATRKLIVTK